MKILIVIPPYVIGEDDRAVLPSKAMLPVGPLMIATQLQQFADVHVVDLVRYKNWKRQLVGQPKPDILLVSCHTVRNIVPVHAVLDFLKQQWGGLRSVHVVLGGNACLDLGNVEFARLGIFVDAVIRGYGHDTTGLIMSRLYGDFKSDQPTPHLPQPAVELLDQKTQRFYQKASDGKYPLVAHGLGCTFRCGYCSSHMNTKWLSRTVDDAIAEARLARSYGYNRLWDISNLLFVDPEANIAFDKAAFELGMAWSGMTRAELVLSRQKCFPALRCLEEVAMGVESGDSELLSNMGRSASVAPSDAFAIFAQRLPATKRTAFAVLDWPDSTEAEFWKLVKVLGECAISSVSWSFYNPPAKVGLFEQGRQPEEFGFYRWPLRFSDVSPERIVQQAMWLVAKYWNGWSLHEKPFFANGSTFGVRCEEGTIFQERSARSLRGDIQERWVEWPEEAIK